MDEKGLEKAKSIVDLLSEKKGEDILLLDLIGQCSFTDYFVICSGPSTRTLRALAEEVRKRMKEQFNGSIGEVEGEPESGWILIDYGDVVLHLFSEPVRRYYGLEELWDQGQVVVHLK